MEEPPESIAVRKILKRVFDETGKIPDNVYWTSESALPRPRN